MNVFEDFLLFLKTIWLNKKSGVLEVRCSRIKRELFFEDGILVSITTEDPQEKIGSILISMGKAKREHIDKAVILNEKVGKFLVKNGYITPEELFSALSFQTKMVISSIINTKDKCEFNFKSEKELKHPKSVNFDFQTIITFLVFYVNIQTVNTSYFREHSIPSIKESNLIKSLIPEGLIMLLKKMDGEKTHNIILKETNFPKTEYIKFIHILKVLGIIEEKELKVEIDDFFKNEIEKFYQLSKEKKFTELFKEKSDLESLKQEYFRLSKKFHPDRVGRDIPPDVKEKIEIIFDAINKGYEILTDPEKRKEFIEEKESENSFNPKEFAKQSFERAKILYKEGLKKEAMQLLETAVRYDKENADYFLFLGIVQSKITGYKKQAEENLKKAIELSPWNPDAYYFLGKLYLDEGLKNKAKAIFEKAYTKFPTYKKIEDEYKKLSSEKKSIFGWLKK